MDHNLLAASALSLAGAIAAGLVAERADRELRRLPSPRRSPLGPWPRSTHPLDLAVHSILRLIPAHWRIDHVTDRGRGLTLTLYGALTATWWLAMLGLACFGRALSAP